MGLKMTGWGGGGGDGVEDDRVGGWREGGMDMRVWRRRVVEIFEG